MKLATYDDGSRDGQLIVVSRDLAQAHYATGIATRLQQLLDDWGFLSPQLEDLATQLNHGRLRHAFNFEPQKCRAPLPRAFGWASADAQAGVTRGGSDDFLGAMDAVRFGSEAMAIGCLPGLAAITGDVAQGVSAAQALDGVRLLMLVADWRLAAVQSGAVHSHAATAFGPVAVTPDELGAAWRGGRVELGLPQAMRNGRKLTPLPDAAPLAAFGGLIAELATTRRLRAGQLIGTLGGPVSSNPLKFGDSIRIDLKAADGQSVFGAIDQDITSTQSTP